MIPISRRTIASATEPLAVARQRLEVDLAELALGGPGARRLGEQRDDERRQPVQVVQGAGGLLAEQDSRIPPSQHLEHDRDLGDAQHVPEADRRSLLAATRPRPTRRRAGSVAMTATPRTRWTVSTALGSVTRRTRLRGPFLMRKITM